MKRKNIYLVIITIIAINLMGSGVIIIKNSMLAMGPIDTLVLALMQLTNFDSFGNMMLFFHLLFLVILIIMQKQLKLSYKTLVISFLTIFINTRIVNFYDMFLTYSNFFSGFLILNLGIYLAAIVNIFIAPYDKFVICISEFLKYDFSLTRIVCDVVVLVLAVTLVFSLQLEVPIGIWTIFIAVVTGINVKLYDKILDLKRRLNAST